MNLKTWQPSNFVSVPLVKEQLCSMSFGFSQLVSQTTHHPGPCANTKM